MVRGIEDLFCCMDGIDDNNNIVGSFVAKGSVDTIPDGK